MHRMFSRSLGEIKAIVSFTREVFDSEDIDASLVNVVDLATEELFVNMVTYNKESSRDIRIDMTAINTGIEVSLTDYDVERFDPTKIKPVDVDAPLEERTVGGLGLYLVMKMVDTIHYEYVNRSSKITFTKRKVE